MPPTTGGVGVLLFQARLRRVRVKNTGDFLIDSCEARAHEKTRGDYAEAMCGLWVSVRE